MRLLVVRTCFDIRIARVTPAHARRPKKREGAETLGPPPQGAPKGIRAQAGFRALGDGDEVDGVGAEDEEGDAKAIWAAAASARDEALLCGRHEQEQ